MSHFLKDSLSLLSTSDFVFNFCDVCSPNVTAAFQTKVSGAVLIVHPKALSCFFSFPKLFLPFKMSAFSWFGGYSITLPILFLWTFLTYPPLICWLSLVSGCFGSSYKPSLIGGSTCVALVMVHMHLQLAPQFSALGLHFLLLF